MGHLKTTKVKAKAIGSKFLTYIQKIGKSLIFPIVVLPAAALFLRIGSFIMDFGLDGEDITNDFLY